MTNTPSPDEDRELIDPSEVKLWNELTDMILEWEDCELDDTAGGLARRIIAIFRRESESLLSDRAKLEERARELEAMPRNAECAHDWKWVKTSVDASNTNFVTVRCSKCLLERTN